jgi:GH18 family chitinase
MTDFIFGFVQSDGNGNFENPTALQNFQACLDLAKANGVKFHISTGGAGLSSTLNGIASNPTRLANFAKNAADLMEQYEIEGFDVDWEFPTPAQVGNHKEMLRVLRSEFDSRGKTGVWELAIAVGAETPTVGSQGIYHTDYVDSDASNTLII